MTAMDELRRMLDERGVERYHLDFKFGHGVGWKDSNGHFVRAEQWEDALLVQAVLTPEQAVDATVGDDTPVYLCPKCCVAYELDFIDKEFGKSNYCPHCGYRRLYV